MSAKLMRVPAVAELLDIPVARAYEMARTGLLPTVRLGRQLRVDPARLEDWIRSGGQPLSGGWRKD